MDSLFPDRDWWLTQFFGPDDDGGDGGEDDGDDQGGDDGDGGDGDKGQKSPEDQIADLQEALRKERSDHRKTKRNLSAAKKGTAKTGDQSDDGDKGGSTGDKRIDKLIARLEAQEETIEGLRKENRMKDAAIEVRRAAEAAGASNTDRIYKIIRHDIEFDDDGEPDNIADLIAEVKTDYPELFKKKNRAADMGGGSGSGKKGGASGDWIRAGIDRELE